MLNYKDVSIKKKKDREKRENGKKRIQYTLEI